MKKILVILLSAVLSGCAVVKVPVASGGSKSDGIVELSYSYGSIEFPQVDYSKADQEALKVCLLWGFKESQAFGGSTEQCHTWDYYGACASATVTIKYQCY